MVRVGGTSEGDLGFPSPHGKQRVSKLLALGINIAMFTVYLFIRFASEPQISYIHYQ